MSDKNKVTESSAYENFIGQKEEVKQSTLQSLFSEEIKSPETWKDHWQDMPEFEQENNAPYKSINVHFRTKEDYENFSKIIDQHLTTKTKSIWHPKLDITKNSLLRWMEDDES
jgi:hypothetical protein